MKPFSPLRVRATALFASAVVSTLAVVGFAAPAQAAALGTLTLSATSGTVATNPMFATAATSAACPAGYGANAALRVGRPGGPYNNLRPIGSANNYDQAPFSLAPNRSFTSAVGAAPGDGDWLIVVDCSGVTTGTHPDRFELTITVAGDTWQVKTAAATPTTTTLDVNPDGPVQQGSPVVLTSTVSPSTAAGSVEFRDGATPLGTAPVSGGTASITSSSLAAGPHQLTAVFVPAVAADYQASTSAAVVLEVTAPSNDQTGTQRITAAVTGGGLSLALAGNTVTLDSGVLGGTATGDLNKATVRDERGSNAGWNLVGQVEQFTGTPGGTIAADQLGWEPTAAKVNGSGSVTAGESLNPGSGLGTAKKLCGATTGASAGVFECSAGLTLGIPISATPGTYTATLTLTLS